MANVKNALITGATSGIGRATAELLAQEGYSLVLTGRRAERLEAMQDELSGKTSVKTLCFDVRDPEAVKSAVQELEEDRIIIDLLVNNAGLALGLDEFHEADMQDWETMIDTNVKGLLYMSQGISKIMIREGIPGHIIHVGSIAGHETYPKGHVYCATKHAVYALTRGMRMDLFKYGIRVGSVDPGMVETEFSEVRFHGDTDRASKVYRGFTPLKAIDVAEVIHFMASRPGHVNIDDVVMMSTDQASSIHVNRK